MRKSILVGTLGAVCAAMACAIAGYVLAGGAARDGAHAQVRLLPPRQWGFSTASIAITVCAGVGGPASCGTSVVGHVRKLGPVQVTRWGP